MAIRSVPDADTNWGPEVRAVIARVNDLGDTVGAVIPANRVGSNSGGTTNFLRADGTFAAPPAGGGGGSGVPAAAQTVYALEPPAGLSAIAANGTTNDAATLQAQINYVSTTWGEGRVVLPGATIRVNSGLTGLGRVRLVGQGKADTTLDFSGAGGSVIAIDSTGNDTMPCEHLRLLGPNGGDKLTYPTNTSIGVRLAGVPARIQHCRIERFFKGVDSTNNNSFFQTLFDVHIGNAGVGWDLNGGTANNGGVVPSEFGEKMVFLDGSIYNSQMGIDLDKSGVGCFVSGTSLDYLGRVATVIDSFLHISNSHIETGYAPTDNANWGATNRWMIDMSFEARLNVSNTRFEVRDPGVFAAIRYDTGPAVYNSGHARFSNCTWYGSMPGVTPGTAPHGEQRQFQSKDMVFWNAADGATKVLRSPFATKWNTIRAYPVYSDGTGIPAGHSVRVTAADVSSVAGDIPEQTVTLARDLAGGTSAANMWVCVEY